MGRNCLQFHIYIFINLRFYKISLYTFQCYIDPDLACEIEGIQKLKCNSKNIWELHRSWSKVVADGKKRPPPKRDPILPILLITARSNLFLIRNSISIRWSLILNGKLFVVKVSKFQKQIFLSSFEPKNERNHFFHFCPKDLK